tara:strand:- start:49 stop:537 length:489 start_codon:yes stop_codon:yes gene_type:complete
MTNIAHQLPHQVFVYGSLKRGEYNNDCITQHGGEFISTATTIGTYLLLGGVFPKLVDPADIDKAQARRYQVYKGRVVGELWRVNERGLLALDRLEGCPVHYRRETLEVDTPHGIRQPWGYIIARPSFVSSPLIDPDASGLLSWSSPRAETLNPFRERAETPR